MKKIMLLMLSAIIISSCSLTVKQTSPKPNLSLGKSSKSIALVLDNTLPDTYKIPQKKGIKSTEVTFWHNSLKNGFENGFIDVFNIEQNPDKADYVLILRKADLSLEPAAVSGYYGVVAITSLITFKAELKDKNGKSKVIATTAGSKSSTNRANEVTDLAKSAIESMYEIISKEFSE